MNTIKLVCLIAVLHFSYFANAQEPKSDSLGNSTATKSEIKYYNENDSLITKSLFLLKASSKNYSVKNNIDNNGFLVSFTLVNSNSLVNVSNANINDSSSLFGNPLSKPKVFVYKDENDSIISKEDFTKKKKNGLRTFRKFLGSLSAVDTLKLVNLATPIKNKSSAIAFSEYALDGYVYDLKSLKGKVIVLNFWFTQCGPCIAEMPDLNDVYDKFKIDTNVVFLAPTFNKPNDVMDFVYKNNFKYTILHTANNIIADYKVYKYPTHVIIDQNGMIVFIQNSGFAIADTLKRKLKKLLR